MDDRVDSDLGLLGLGRGGKAWPLAECARAAGAAVLEMKSAQPLSPVDRLAALLDDLTQEMREQFELFRQLRAAAVAILSGTAEGDSDTLDEAGASGVDEAAAKAARADAKAATDAIALIVRTLEKIDSLQRQLARDREDAALSSGEGEDDEAIKAELLRIIEAQAESRAKARFEAWRADGEGLVAGGAVGGADGGAMDCIGGEPEPPAPPGMGSG
ncbi:MULTISPECIES: hypothetical protein [Alphaproteobacteria]|uniref:Uncharacterized protein n=2 Tax=Alphaproteobacteria TaxID=28211 RepID=A0A512HFZ5_9HYPH|nr:MULTISPECIES: hypothetical protein [Alphaproteobacteria]GEO84369.1 hypothetical protein RNA01_13010 [Ciceribacter naphthalenivorans]GLR22332.1 hypothetical protein GCM10007920_21190 [Ciceribacter naphthalenivorans]GLT05188.1 hypothetical protein GCM10007926_21190 [Sphingomonas psychrolutea]